MTENLIIEILGKKYLLFDYPITGEKQNEAKEMFKSFSCIMQGIKEVKQSGFFTPGYVIVRVLVPEENVLAFNSYEL